MPNFCGYPDGPCELSYGEHIHHHRSRDLVSSPWERGEPTFDERVQRERQTMTGRFTARGAAPAAKPAGSAPASPPATRHKRMTLEAMSTSSGILREPHRILIYGVGGVGKTTFLAESPKPAFIDTQGGSLRMDVMRFPRPESYQDVLDAIDELINGEHDRETLCIDLLDDVEDLLWKHICKRDDKVNIEDYGYGKGYKVALDEWRSFAARLERLRRARSMRVIFAAHSFIRKFQNPEGEDYDRYGLQVHELAAGFIRGWCDTVLFARHETFARTVRKRTRGVSTGARLLQTIETAAYYAKNRDYLPDTLDFDWTAFAEAVENGTKPEVIRAEIQQLADQVDADTHAKVIAAVANAGDDPNQLARVLNRLREIVPSNQTQQQTEESAQ